MHVQGGGIEAIRSISSINLLRVGPVIFATRGWTRPPSKVLFATGHSQQEFEVLYLSSNVFGQALGFDCHLAYTERPGIYIPPVSLS